MDVKFAKSIQSLQLLSFYRSEIWIYRYANVNYTVNTHLISCILPQICYHRYFCTDKQKL